MQGSNQEGRSSFLPLSSGFLECQVLAPLISHTYSQCLAPQPSFPLPALFKDGNILDAFHAQHTNPKITFTILSVWYIIEGSLKILSMHY